MTRGPPSIRPMGKKNAAAGVGLAAVAATVTAANTRAVVRVGRMETSIGAWTDFTSAGWVCRIMVWIDVMDITKWSISGSEKSVPPKIIKKIEMRGYSP